jgi:hypothetical protein
MSYCRWSSDDFQCDVYVYAHVNGGWTTHVANSRHKIENLPPEVPLPVGFSDDEWSKYVERERKVMELVKTAELVPLNLPHDGETFSDPTPGACADRLEMLRTAGYNVPQYAIDSLRNDNEEQYQG